MIPHPTRPRLLFSNALSLRQPREGGLLFALLAAAALAVSCSGGDDSAGNDQETALKKRDLAKTALDTAVEEGLDKSFPEDFEKEQNRFNDAEGLVEKKKFKEAGGRFSTVRTNVDKLVKRWNVTKEKLAALDDVIKEVEKAKKYALTVKAPEFAKTEFAEAEKLFTQVQADIKTGDEKKVLGAKTLLERAKDTYTRALSVARDNKKTVEEIDKQKAAIEAQKKLATEKQAEKHAAQDLAMAQEREKAAEKELKNGNYRRALDLFEECAGVYQQTVKTATDMLAAEDEAKKALVDAGQGKQPQGTPQPEVQQPTPPPEAGKPEAGTPVASDADAIIMENLEKLAPSLKAGPSSYNPISGKIDLTYTGPQILKKDIPLAVLNRTLGKQLQWKDPLLAGMESGGPQPPGGRNEPVIEGTFIFSGNTGGYFIVPVPLTGEISVQFKVGIMTMGAWTSMGPLLFANESGLTSWWADFGTLKRWVDKKAPQEYAPQVQNPDYRRDPDKWFDKKIAIPIRLSVTPDEKRPDLYSWLQLFITIEDEEILFNKMQISSKLSGYFGFRWTRTKFRIFDLKVSGQLDKAAALKQLKAQGVKVDTAQATPPPAKGETEPAAKNAAGGK